MIEGNWIVPPSDGVGNGVAYSEVVRGEVVPSLSYCPLPQHHTPPFTIAHECANPAASASTPPVRPTTWTGTSHSVD